MLRHDTPLCMLRTSAWPPHVLLPALAAGDQQLLAPPEALARRICMQHDSTPMNPACMASNSRAAPQVINNCTHHQKAVHGFVWCSAYSMFASCGLERDIILWQVVASAHMHRLSLMPMQNQPCDLIAQHLLSFSGRWVCTCAGYPCCPCT